MIRSAADTDLLTGEFLLRRGGCTLADYDRLADEDTRLDLIDEVLIMHSPANVRHELLFKFLLRLLDGHATRQDLGLVLGSRTAMILDDDRRVEPDLLFIRKENLGRLGDTALEGPADLVIEILSPATREYDLGEKRDAYAAAGVPEYWMVDPMRGRLLVDRPAGTRAAELSAGRCESAALPGFRIDAAWLFRDPLPSADSCLREIIGG